MTNAPDFADWLAIANLKARYCRMLDTKDWEGFAALFIDDVVVDTTASGGPRFEGCKAFLAGVRPSVEAAKTTHHVHSPEIEIDGDSATAIWAMQDRLVWPDGRALSGSGHYHDKYVRCSGAWKIAESRLTRLDVEMTAADNRQG